MQTIIKRATLDDATIILEIQKEAYYDEAVLYDDLSIQPLVQTSEENIESFTKCIVLKLEVDGEIAGSIRGELVGHTCLVGKLMIRKKHQGKRLSYKLLEEIESYFPNATHFELFTGYKSLKNIHIYRKIGYQEYKFEPSGEKVMFVHMIKKR